MRLNTGVMAFLVLAMVGASCATDSEGPANTNDQPGSSTTVSTDSIGVTETTHASTTTTAAEKGPEPTRRALLLAAEQTLGYWMPMATDGASVVYADFDEALTTVNADGTHRLALTDIFVGESVTVSAVTRFRGLYWAFVQGDELTKPGVSSAVVSSDGLAWERIEIGSSGSAARVPGGFATPDAVQYPGASGVLDASTDGETLAVSGWTQTDAGAQPTVWTSTDGEAWTTDILPNKSSVAETAPKVAMSGDTRLVHTLGPYYLGPDLVWMRDASEEDASLVGVDVSDVAGGPDHFVALASHFGSSPYSFWEFDNGVWSVIDAPAWAGFDDADGRHPYLLIDSSRGAVVVGAAGVGLRAAGAWIELGHLAGDPVSATAEGGSIVIVTMLEDGIGLIPIPLPR